METRLHAATRQVPRVHRVLVAGVGLMVMLTLPACGNAAGTGATAGGGATAPTAGSTPSGDPHGPPAILPADARCPRPGSQKATTMIDYIDFVQVNGHQYARFGPARVTHVQVGERIGVVRCRLEGSAAGANYSPVDGDAAFLAPGTEVFALRDRPVTEAVAVRLGGGYAIYRGVSAAGPGRAHEPPKDLSGPLGPTS